MKEQFPRHVSCREMRCCSSLFQKEQGKQLFYSAAKQLHPLDLCTEAAVIRYEIHKQRIEVLPEVLFQSSSSALLFYCRNHVSYASYFKSLWHVLL